MTLAELQRIKQWHVEHRDTHPLEYHLWDAMLTLWVMGWMGLVPAWAIDQVWSIPLCLLATLAPGAYVGWRVKAHRLQRLRCDWVQA